MIELSKGGAYLVDGVDVIEESAAQQGALAARLGTDAPSKEEAAKNTIAYSILESHKKPFSYTPRLRGFLLIDHSAFTHPVATHTHPLLVELGSLALALE